MCDNEDLTLLENYFRKYYPHLKGSHFTTLTDIVYMAAFRNHINIKILLDDLYKGILDLEFRRCQKGNLYAYINPKYKKFAERIKDITVGSNGGKANKGKGEWLISILHGIDPETNMPRVNVIKGNKKRKGDLLYLDSNKTEEVKWNGGKVSVEKSGKEINQIFNKMIKINDKSWIPLRDNDKEKYSEEEIKTFNAVYWNAISNENISSLSDNELKMNVIIASFKKMF